MLESWKPNVLFPVEHGEFVCIIGANGCGKTTTLKTVLGLMKPTADEIIRTDEKWSHISDVKNGRVYTMPNAPFAWCNRPPGVNRFLGVQWIANMLYLDRYDVDMVEEVKNFYSLLYWVDITDDDARELLGNSYPPYGKQ